MHAVTTAGLRFIGAGYCLLKADWPKTLRFAQESRTLSRHGGARALVGAVLAPFRYGTSPEEYFLFGFYDKLHVERKRWVGTVGMWLAQRRFVPAGIRGDFADKTRFTERYRELMDGSARFHTATDDPEPLLEALRAGGHDIFIKPADGQCGTGASVLSIEELRRDGRGALARATAGGGIYIVERRLINHPDIQRIAPDALSTIRVVTAVTTAGDIEFLFARARFSIGKVVDNLGSGGLAVPVDLDTGVISGPAVASASLIERTFERHPKTGETFQGKVIPMWDAVLDLAQRSALRQIEARVIGWDIAVTPDGPLLLEGNHNWGKVLWQMPVDEGMAQELERIKARVLA
ncbi:sugar-transfer associated ATP-grasp domain-containing protein [Halomonas maura]|uniref:sugar-transfer associated ATP-grasp domain-containing protein n=1 Tax=Halomonas maura TaxID=117606 RepID=UPI0025B55502|nr:sugar-transfer associated ATP-grasp domain-containing protein [Halomonas maura]MDN3555252.1 sugar-transfer associated ATP-grasp domain-containing protein [Halomonas maura]